MKIVKNIFSKFYLYLLWTMCALMLVGWIFTLMTDTVPKKKVTVFADVVALDDVELSIELEEYKPENIKMVKVHTFSYVAFSSTSIVNGDIYVIRQSDIEDYIASFCPLTDEVCAQFFDQEFYYSEGAAYGIKVYDAQTSVGVAAEYINYSPVNGEDAQDYYLFFNKNSLHGGALNGCDSDAALVIASALLAL